MEMTSNATGRLKRLLLRAGLIPGIGLPISQVIAGCVVVFAGAALLYLRKNHKKMPMMKSGKQYEPMPDKIVGKKPPKKKDKIFKF